MRKRLTAALSGSGEHVDAFVPGIRRIAEGLHDPGMRQRAADLDVDLGTQQGHRKARDLVAAEQQRAWRASAGFIAICAASTLCAALAGGEQQHHTTERHAEAERGGEHQQHVGDQVDESLAAGDALVVRRVRQVDSPIRAGVHLLLRSCCCGDAI